MAVLNHQLAEAAKLSGVIKPEHFAIFTDRGYQGLYKGETENMIHARKGLQEGEHILDFMGSDELIANAFRQRLCNWAIALEKEHLVKLSTYFPQSGPQARQRNYEWMSVAMR